VLSLTDDIAVFCQPDNQELNEPAEQYEEFTTVSLPVGQAPPAHDWGEAPGVPGYVLSLDGEWQPCSVCNGGRFLTLDGVKIDNGMSGSPILNADGAAIGLISTGSEGFTNNRHPSLIDCLPPWLVKLT
jgi:hypothetical protein